MPTFAFDFINHRIIQQKSTYRIAVALSLTLLILNAFIGKDIVHLFVHHDHGTACEMDHSGEANIHGHDHHFEDCLLCDFVISPAQRTAAVVYPQPLLNFTATLNAPITHWVPRAEQAHTSNRGPPSLV